MVPSPKTVELTPETRGILKAFLDSMAGENFIQALNALCPAIITEGTAENQLAAAHQHGGYEKCLENILFFIEPLPPEGAAEAASAYPDLDDDDESKWKDGKKPA